jgi:CheY-like chemotaxis protein
MDIESLVQSLGHRVNGVARTHSEAIEAVEEAAARPGAGRHQLADGSSGLDAVNEMLASFSVPVVFITAYPGTPADRRAPGTGVSDHQAFPAGNVESGNQPGPCSSSAGPSARRDPPPAGSLLEPGAQAGVLLWSVGSRTWPDG